MESILFRGIGIDAIFGIIIRRLLTTSCRESRPFDSLDQVNWSMKFIFVHQNDELEVEGSCLVLSPSNNLFYYYFTYEINFIVFLVRKLFTYLRMKV